MRPEAKASETLASLFRATSEQAEAPRSNTAAGLADAGEFPRSRATRRRMYSARDTPRSLARRRARRWISGSRVIWVRDIMTSPSYRNAATVAYDKEDLR